MHSIKIFEINKIVMIEPFYYFINIEKKNIKIA